jgi:predicted nucleic acid-binding protein
MKCLDTYALVEINNGNPKFAGLLSHDLVITDITMAEFYALMYRAYDLKTADYWHKKMYFFCKAVSRDILLKAARFRVDNNRQNLSFFDCVGYVYALENNMKFVTGDKEFRNRKGVEFIER